MNQNRITKFYKVSFDQFLEDYAKIFLKEEKITQSILETVQNGYDNLQLPVRSTSGSAGYDFYSPFNYTIKPDETALIPTGIRCQIEDGWVLTIYPRSSLGFKYQLNLVNTVGIIDADYSYAKNEGHIMVKFVNHGNEEVNIKSGDKIVQGIFLPFGITYNDEANGERTGGFGSTGK